MRLGREPEICGHRSPRLFGVLHTWGRTLEYHPHVHYVVPGGGIDEAGSRWLPSRVDFLVPVKALSILFRAKFRDILAREPAPPGRPGGLAAQLGGQLAGCRRRPSLAALPRPVRLPSGNR